VSALFARIAKTTADERWLLAEATFALAVASFLIAVAPFRRVAALARTSDGGPVDAAEQSNRIAAVRWAVAASARRVPWRAKCIEQGFAAQWMLTRRGVPAVLHYGVARREGELVAHVWVQSDAIDVIGCENREDFAEVARFPAVRAH
jgi:hypothetical protein